MKFTCHKEDLLQVVQTVTKAISTKNTLPALNGILLKVEENSFTMRCTDLEITIECSQNCDTISCGETVILDGRRFNEIVRQLPNVDISVSLVDKRDIMIEYNDSSFFVRGIDDDQFPEIPSSDALMNAKIKADVFNKLVKQVTVAASSDESRPVFTGTMLDIKGDEIILVATDTHRLNFAQGSWQSDGDLEKKLVVPAKTLIEVAKIGQLSEEINVVIARNFVKFYFANVVFISRLINGNFPDYKKVFPKEEAFVAHAVINKKTFFETLQRANLLARDNNSIVKLEWRENALTIKAEAADIGNIKETIAVDYAGSNVDCAYNVKYILDMLKVTTDENIYWKITGPLTPAVIHEASNDNFQALILPIRL